MPATLTDEEVSAFRAKLCAEAERQFSEQGVEAVSMRSLAKALGCSPTTPYRYFENKEAILAAVRASILHRVSETLEAVQTGQPDAASWARAQLKAFVDFAFDEPAAYRLVYDLYQPGESQYPELARATARSVNTTANYVKQFIAEGYFEGDPLHIGQLYLAAVHGLLGLHMTGRLVCTRKQFDKTCREVLRLITLGLQAEQTASKAGTVQARARSKPPANGRRTTKTRAAAPKRARA